MSTPETETPPEKGLPATRELFELEVIRLFEREMGAYITMLEQMGVRLARLERRVRQLEGAHNE